MKLAGDLFSSLWRLLLQSLCHPSSQTFVLRDRSSHLSISSQHGLAIALISRSIVLAMSGLMVVS